MKKNVAAFTATTARDPEAFIERISEHGPSDLLVESRRSTGRKRSFVIGVYRFCCWPNSCKKLYAHQEGEHTAS